MIKKLTVTLCVIFTTLMASAAVGTWKIHPTFGSTPTNAIDVGDKVYYLVSNTLYCYDKETSENIAYDRSNYLNDSQVQNIYYNYSKNYLLVVYNNSNIDMILANGKVVNIPDINNALLTTAKTVNDVVFCGNYAYVATAFGYVVINDQKYEISESRIYGVNVKSAAKVGNTLLLSTASGLYFGDASKQHSTMASLSLLSSYVNTKLYPLDGDAFLQCGSTTATYKVEYDDNGAPTGISQVASIASSVPSIVQPVKALNTLAVQYITTPCYYSVSGDGATVTRVVLPSSVKNEIATSQEADGSWWTVGANGLRKISIDGTTATTLVDYQKLNASTVTNPYMLSYNQGLDLLYVSNSGKFSLINPGTVTTTLNSLSGSNWAEINPEITQNRNSSRKYLYNTYRPLVDLNDCNTFYLGSEYEGLFKFTNNEQVALYDWTNSPLTNNGGFNCEASAYQFDKAGNLWLIQAETASPIMVLPKDKLNAETTTASDWIIPNFALTKPTNWRQHFVITKKSDIKVYTNGDWASRIFFINDHGDPTSDAITMTEYLSGGTYDQDNRSFSWAAIYNVVEDNDGMIWVGCDQGIVRYDPVKCAERNGELIYRPKVPRNDGTNNADYLLEGVRVNCIAVDGMNRKWIGTESSGLYLVSADGTEILEEFSTTNSILPSDKIISLCCNPKNNNVYVGVVGGLLEYESDATTPSKTYDNVYVYPNPVRPDYTGIITIKGLMENSLVKIADSAGNVVMQTQSNGGMATWDGCNSDGSRVKSGVYFVLASENENEQSNAVVAKFLIIR
ncbi:MAG: hypothetical protein ACI308_06865 [Muribaculaceae bacterium]